MKQATGYASQHIRCLFQARIKWEVVPVRAYGIKWWGWQRFGCQIVRMGWQSIRIVVCLCYLHFPPENPEDDEQRFEYRLRKQEVGKPR